MVDNPHEVRIVSQAFEMTLEVRGCSFKLCVGASHPTEVVGATIVRRCIAGDVIHLFVPSLTTDDGCAVGHGRVQHRFRAVLCPNDQLDVFGVRSGEQLNENPVAFDGYGTVDVDDAVDEEQDIMGGSSDSKAFAHQQYIVPFTGPKDGVFR